MNWIVPHFLSRLRISKLLNYSLALQISARNKYLYLVQIGFKIALVHHNFDTLVHKSLNSQFFLKFFYSIAY